MWNVYLICLLVLHLDIDNSFIREYAGQEMKRLNHLFFNEKNKWK